MDGKRVGKVFGGGNGEIHTEIYRDSVGSFVGAPLRGYVCCVGEVCGGVWGF